jgi:hypothetical protein
MMNLPSDLELHPTFQHDHEFVRRMGEVLPPLSGRVDPEVATESPLRPIGGYLFSMGHRPRSSILDCIMANTIQDQLIAGLMLWSLLSLGTATIGTPGAS